MAAKGLLLSTLVLSGCSVIATEPPADPSKYAEVDVKIADGSPEVQISDVAVFTGFSSKYFGFTPYHDRIMPTRLFLSPDSYQIQYECYGTIAIGYMPLFNITVESGKKYWLECDRTDGIYIKQQ